MRESGILMPVSSLPGPYGIGCFGKEAFKFVDFLAQAGQKIWQILPLSPTGYGDSPYQSCSAFAGNPYFIDLDALKEEGLLTAAQLKAEKWGTDPKEVDYGTLYVSRFKVLRTAYAAWRKQCTGLHGCSYYFPDDYYAFTLANEEWLDDYALYMALKVANGMKNWVEWDKPYRLRDKKALAAFAAENEEEIGFWKFVQYKFAAQWQAVKAYANKKDVQILGDIPIYVSADSVDAWVGGALFELDADGGFARVAGCPPDYFSADGQLWGNPLYNWAYHKKDRLRVVGAPGAPRTGHLRPAAHRPLPRLRYLLGHPGGQHHRPHRQVGERPRHGAVRCAGSCPWQAAHHCRGLGRTVPQRAKAAGRQHLPGHEGAAVRLQRRGQRVSAPQLHQEQRSVSRHPR